VKSRLSSLIAAVSGKISSNSSSSIKPTSSIADETTNNSLKRSHSDDGRQATKTSPQLEKWHSALKISHKPGQPLLLDSCHRGEQQQHGVMPAEDELEEEGERPEDDGRLITGRLLLGTKILVEREADSGRLYPAVISGQDGPRLVVTWKGGEPGQVTAPTHYEAGDLLKAGVQDLPALSSDRLRSGSRVAVFPYADAAHLIPGTVRNGGKTSHS
jgi:hypothetical protein